MPPFEMTAHLGVDMMVAFVRLAVDGQLWRKHEVLFQHVFPKGLQDGRWLHSTELPAAGLSCKSSATEMT